DFLDLDNLLMLLRLPGALLLLVLIAAEVHDAADRWRRRRGDLDEVEPLLLGDRQGLLRRHDPQLLARIVDHPDFTHPDPFIHPRAVVPPRASVVSDRTLQRKVELVNW